MLAFSNLTIDKQIGIKDRTNGDILKTKILLPEFPETILFKSKILHLQITTSNFHALRILGLNLGLLVILKDRRDLISSSKIKFMRVYKVGLSEIL
jgi:hypothetical protein